MQIVNGKIGIGTSSPAVAVDVNAGDVAGFVRSESNSVSVAVISLGTVVYVIVFKKDTSLNEYNVRVGVDGNYFVAYTNNLKI
ncbi:hypothetical protein [Flavobacterium ginsengiterrae]|uniref:Uncharacterized protein n=1 Tax=Flavobacterium ginsengiterrae TaxID=871695 RepID=A0ABP7GXH0_9FLAO